MLCITSQLIKSLILKEYYYLFIIILCYPHLHHVYHNGNIFL